MSTKIQNQLPLDGYAVANDEIVRHVSRFIPIKALRSCDFARDQGLEHPNALLIGGSKLMRDLKSAVLMVARSAEPVLITGESGTGKELIARGIHDLGPRRSKPFLAVNCGALNESLLESELFGHVKGAFTGATINKKGFFEAASGGTIFLDEFAEMSLATQQRLLRVLQEGKVRPVGSTEPKEIEIDTRILVATHHDLDRDISEGKFRSDLYYRVNVLQIRAPALRERRGDILELAQHFIRKYNKKNLSQISEDIASDVLTILEQYLWPGNVRELENIVKRLALNVSERGWITADDVCNIRELNQLCKSTEAQYVTSVEQHQVARRPNCLSMGKRARCHCSEQLDLYRNRVDQAEGNVAEAARQLGIPRTTLRKRMIALQSKCAS